jgi:hypothetical protein
MNDADIEMNELTVTANHESRLRRRGICAHGWVQRAHQTTPHLTGEQVQCKDCGKVFADFETLNDERQDILA